MRVLFLILLSLSFCFGQSQKPTNTTNTTNENKKDKSMYAVADIVREPYQSHRIYKLKLVAGAPVVIELPQGEVVKNIWIDTRWFTAESIEGSKRVIVRAIDAQDVEAQQTTLNIESVRDYRYTFHLECVPLFDEIPVSVFSFYFTGDDQEVQRKREIAAAVAMASEAHKAQTESIMKAEFERWKTETLARVSNDYQVNGTIWISKVVDDGVQSWIFVNALNEVASIHCINRDKEVEVVNFEYLNNSYVINRVLVSGEQFVLTVGKDKTVIRRR